MEEIPIKKYVRFLFGIAILIFFLNKFFLRPWILENDLPKFLQIVSFSIPNLIEATVGTLLLTGILFQVRQYYHKKFGNIKEFYIHILAVSIAAIYAITQELKFHNLGGNNVYDPYDIIASVMGLVGTFGLIQMFGFSDKLEIDKRKEM